MERVDAVVIGAGVAGLTAGMYLHNRGRKTLVLEKKPDRYFLGGRARSILRLENYPGFEGVTGDAFVDHLVAQIESFNVPIKVNHDVVDIEAATDEKKVKVQTYDRQKDYRARILFLCIGGGHSILGVPGEEMYYYRGVDDYVMAIHHGNLFIGRRVAVVGPDNRAVQTALHLSQFARKVLYITHGPAIFDAYNRDQLEIAGIEYYEGSRVREIEGDGGIVRRIIIEKEGEILSKRVRAVIIATDPSAKPELPRKAGCALDANGRIIVSKTGETNISGIYSAGDCVHGSGFSVASAVDLVVAAVKDSDKYF
ncbi:MAG: NAD(P)/FAD-dependent oxidoreductase [Candidatus Hodarchaeota archaeon]